MLLLLNAVWSLLAHQSYHNPTFDTVFTSHDVLVSLFSTAGFVLLPDLERVLSGSRPSLSWFSSSGFSIFHQQDRVPYKSWGVYLHVFVKPGFLPLFYCGSATSSELGLRGRFKDYRIMHAVSQEVMAAHNDGFVLDHTLVLLHCPIPQPADQPRVRALCLALEAAFSAIFWSMLSTTTDYGHLRDNAIWSLEDLPWSGLCTHSALLESVSGVELTAEELAAVAEQRRLRKNEVLRAWAKADNVRQRANPTPEFTAKRTRINARRYKGKKKQRDEAVANKTHFCDLCEKSYTSAAELENHRKTPLHLRRLARGEKGFTCAPCDASFPNKTRYDRHCATDKHLKNIS